MSSIIPPHSTLFREQRAQLVAEIAQSMDAVLNNLNRLNRSLDAIITVGNEFGNVEALWSTFEGFMGDRNGGGVGVEETSGDATAAASNNNETSNGTDLRTEESSTLEQDESELPEDTTGGY